MELTPQPLKNSQASSFRREKLGFVFQDFNLLDTLSVKDNILLPLVLSRRPITEMMKKLVVTAENLGINQLQEKYPLRDFWWPETACSSSTRHHH